jgi:hypothetical protein
MAGRSASGSTAGPEGCDLFGWTPKQRKREIAALLTLSKNTILFHRHTIRTMLGLRKSNKDLRSYLLAFEI